MTESPSDLLLRPEVELRTKVFGNEWFFPNRVLVTSLDLLEVYRDGKPVIKKDMGHTDFAQYCDSNDFTKSGGPCLRVFFFEDLYLPLPVHAKATNDNAHDHPPTPTGENTDKTALLMHKHFDVPMSFFLEQDHYVAHTTTGNSTYFRRNEEGNTNSLNGYYQFCSEYHTDKPGYVWFSLSFEPQNRASCYVIFKAPAVTKRLLLECAEGTNWRRLTLPFAIDAFLLNDCIMQMSFQINDQRRKLLDIERAVVTANGPLPDLSASDTNIRTLYVAAREFRCISDNLDGVKAILDFLLGASDQLTKAGYPSTNSDLESIQSSFALLKTKAVWMAREVSSIEDRARLRITIETSLIASLVNPAKDTISADEHLEKGVLDSSSTVTPSIETLKRPRLWRRLLPAFILKGVSSGKR